MLYNDYVVTQESCRITTNRYFDYETERVHRFYIRATDSGLPLPIYGRSMVVAHILDVNDNPPSFLQPFYSLEWPYDDVTLSIGDIDASDVDTNEGGIISYSFVQEDQYFDIAVDTGMF